ncbi:MAG: CRISPR-associated endonuclease Cas1 [Sphingobacterium sp.]|nr:CRISPR-associated endonuclease Cas1 [Sphingobacterium sp.]
MARAIVCSGFMPCFGIHHANKLNAYNLADDLIEPYRPFIDDLVYSMFQDMDEEESHELIPSEKQELIGILSKDCLFKNEYVSILKSCEYLAHSLVNATKAKDFNLLELPELIV